MELFILATLWAAAATAPAAVGKTTKKLSPPCPSRCRRARPAPWKEPALAVQRLRVRIPQTAQQDRQPSMSENNSVTGPGNSPITTSWTPLLHDHHIQDVDANRQSWRTVLGMSRQNLVAISAAQLVAGIAGQLLARRRGLAFDIAVIGWKGRPDRVAGDSWLLGTGLSAPVTMLAAQAAATAHFAATGSQNSARALGLLGAAMVGGYLVEQEFRTAMTPATWDGAVTPVAAAGFALAVAMGRLGLSGRAVI